MMNCPNCGTQASDEAHFCTKCGHKFEVPVQTSLGENPAEENLVPTMTKTVEDETPSSNTINAGTINNVNLGNKAGLIGAIMVLIGFFMPWIDLGFFSLSGFDAVFNKMGQDLEGGRFLLLILPVSAGIFLFKLFTSKGDRSLIHILKIIPLIFIIISALYLISKINGGRHGNYEDDSRGGSSADILKIFGLGFWFTLIGAIIMAFHKDYKNNPSV